MAFTAWTTILLALLSADPGNHLLDYASGEVYWKSKGVAVSVDAMLAELKAPADKDVPALIVDLGSPDVIVRGQAERGLRQMGAVALPQLDTVADANDPQISAAARAIAREIRGGGKATQVRRLMAIRTAGTLGDVKAVAKLEPLLQSREMFVAEYAARSIARLQNKPHRPKVPTRDERLADIHMLAAESRMVLSASLPQDGAATGTIDELLEKVLLQAGAPNAESARAKEELTGMVVKIAEKVGDIRIDHIAIGLSGDAGKDGGFASIIIRGEFDAAAARSAITELLPGREKVGGFDVHSAEGIAQVFIASDTLAAGVVGANLPAPPVAQLAENVKNGRGKLADVAEINALIRKIDGNPTLFAVSEVTPSYRRLMPELGSLDTLIFTASAREKGTDFSLIARGADPNAVKQLADRVNQGIQVAVAQARQMAAQMPAMRPVVEFLESAKVSTDGHSATLTAQMSGTPSAMLLPLLFGARAQAQPALPPPPPQP